MSRHHRIWRLPLFVTSEVKAETSEINQDTCTRVSQCLGLLPLETSRHMCQQPWSAVWYVANSEQILDHRSEKEMLTFYTGFPNGSGKSYIVLKLHISVSVCLCTSVTNTLKTKVKYQQKALDVRNKPNIERIQLKILGLKVMTVICLS